MRTLSSKPVPTTGANFTSQLFHGTIKFAGKKDLHVFAKVSVLGDTLRKEAGSFDLYLMEPYFYTQIVKRFRELEDENDVPEENRLNVPKCYGYSNNYLKEVLVMEDLTKDSFVTYDRLKSVDWEYASKSFEEMAKFHALSIAYMEKYPEDYEEAEKMMKRLMSDENSAVMEILNRGKKESMAMVRDENKAKLEKFFESFDPEKFSGFYEPRKKTAIIHSDFRPSNLLHKHYEMLPFGLTIAMMTLPAITINLEDVTTNAEGVFVSESYADMGEMMSKSNSLCAERINEVVEDYIKWGVL